MRVHSFCTCNHLYFILLRSVLPTFSLPDLSHTHFLHSNHNKCFSYLQVQQIHSFCINHLHFILLLFPSLSLSPLPYSLSALQMLQLLPSAANTFDLQRSLALHIMAVHRKFHSPSPSLCVLPSPPLLSPFFNYP